MWIRSLKNVYDVSQGEEQNNYFSLLMMRLRITGAIRHGNSIVHKGTRFVRLRSVDCLCTLDGWITRFLPNTIVFKKKILGSLFSLFVIRYMLLDRAARFVYRHSVGLLIVRSRPTNPDTSCAAATA